MQHPVGYRRSSPPVAASYRGPPSDIRRSPHNSRTVLDYLRPGILDVLRPVTVEAMTTSTAATATATIQRTQSIPALPFPPKAL